MRNSRRGNQSLAQRLARNLIKRRKELSLTQAELAERLEGATETLSRFERARHLPSLKMLERMAGALRMPIADLLGDAASAPEVELDQSRLTAALDGSLRNVEFRTDKYFGFAVPTALPGVPSEILDPVNTWKDKAEFDATARKLVGMFQQNFAKYENTVDPEVRAAAPEVRMAAE